MRRNKLAKLRVAESGERYKTPEAKTQAEIDIAKARQVPKENKSTVTLILNDGKDTKINATEVPSSGETPNHWVGDNGIPIHQDAIKKVIPLVKDDAEVKGTPFEVKYNQNLKSGMDVGAAFKDAMTAVAESDPIHKLLMESDAAKAKSEAEKLKSQENPDTYNQLADMTGGNIHKIAEMADGFKSDPDKLLKFGTAVKNKFGHSIPSKLGAAEKTRENAADRTLGNIKIARQLIQDPQMAQFIGPILGREGELSQWSGAMIPGIPDNLQQKAQQLRGALKYVMFIDASAINTRVPANLVKELKSVSPDAVKALPLLLGTLDNAEFQSNNVKSSNRRLMLGDEQVKIESKDPLDVLMEGLK